MFSHVLIGIDGREGGRDAIGLARELAAPGAKLAAARRSEPTADWPEAEPAAVKTAPPAAGRS